jgi:hypothetical protein
MSAFGGKADMTLCGNPRSRSLLGVKRTSLFCGASVVPQKAHLSERELVDAATKAFDVYFDNSSTKNPLLLAKLRPGAFRHVRSQGSLEIGVFVVALSHRDGSALNDQRTLLQVARLMGFWGF